MYKLLLTICFIFIFGISFSQSNTEIIDTVNHSVFIRSAAVDTLIQRVINLNDKEPKINGYRIQIYSGSNHSKANEIKGKFMTSYPDEYILLFYQQPNFKVRVGNYRDRIEAMKMYHTLINDIKFKSVLLVPDKIELPDLKHLAE